ncbi:large conductance mechanosensitive channel protein MscL [Buchananella felis]|uniref:large conductance mechanosensitive channel protein MscL n=1 Tax=Buchananella felis TaxID=3231492 RepID=UPI003527778D
MLKGFKDFITRGNVVDLAVGVIVGAAFSGIVNALNEKFLSPLIAGIFGQPNFDAIGQFTVRGAVVQPGAIATAVLNFLIVAASLYFFVVLPLNKMAEARKKNEEEAPEAPVKTDEAVLLEEIRDLLKKQ